MNIDPQDPLTLLHLACTGTLATHSAKLPGYPYATAVPCVTDAGHRPVICVSALAEHTQNLLADARIGLSVMQPDAADVQAAPRLTLVGDAERFDPTPEFVARYLRYEPNARPLLALDFMFFRLPPKRIRFIEGFGRMGWVDASDWQDLSALPDAAEAALVNAAQAMASGGVEVLGVDGYGVDYRVVGKRRGRLRFVGAPLALDTIEETMREVVPRFA